MTSSIHERLSMYEKQPQATYIIQLQATDPLAEWNNDALVWNV